MFELRARTSLARAQIERGDTRAAQELLEPLCGWFGDGVDAADLREARGLLLGA